jgi:predicted nuclease of restriction endonuclease-like (RecB) superfamily
MLSIDNEDKREFYISEASKNMWNARELERQVNSQLYERLLISNDKQKVLAVAKNEKFPEKPEEIIKDPMI